MHVKPLNEIKINVQSETLNRLDDERKEIGMNIYDLEDKSGVTINTFYAWKRGDRAPTLGNFVAIAETLGFEVIMRPMRE